MSKSKSYAEIATQKKYKNVALDWPDLNNQQNNKIKHRTPVVTTELDPELNVLTNKLERLNTNGSNAVNETEKSRDEIRAERRIRRKCKKDEKREQLFQEKLAQIREPKSQKVQIVDKTVMEKYLTSRKLSPVRCRRQSKLKNHSAIKVDLVDLINTKVVKPIDRSSIQSRQKLKITSGTQCHKGKKSEIRKKKYVSMLKRSILLSRLQRNQMKSKADNEPNNVDSETAISNSNEPIEVETSKNIEVPLNKHSSNSSGVVFSRKFRPYCDNLTSPDLTSLTEALLRDIFRFQDRAYNKNEIKARSQRRYVVGFKESMRQLDIGKIKLLIIAPDLETGGVTEVIEEMKLKCQKADIPYLFSLKRRQLGYVLLKKVPVSCVGILNYQGSEENSQKLLALMQQEKSRFQSAMCSISSENKLPK